MGNAIYRRDGNSWTRVSGWLNQIDVGSSMNVIGVNSNNNVYKKNNGNGWTQIPNQLKHVSVGADDTVIGIKADSDDIYLYDGDDWHQVCGNLDYIEVGSKSQIWGTKNGNVYRATNSVPSAMKVAFKTDTSVFGTGDMA